MPGYNKRCDTCKKTFYTSKGNEHCRPCMRDLGLLTEEQNKRILQRIIKDACGDAKNYKTEIFLYSAKQKWNLLSELDYYKIADLYLKIICDGFKYSQNEPEIDPPSDRIRHSKYPLRFREPKRQWDGSLLSKVDP